MIKIHRKFRLCSWSGMGSKSKNLFLIPLNFSLNERKRVIKMIEVTKVLFLRSWNFHHDSDDKVRRDCKSSLRHDVWYTRTTPGNPGEKWLEETLSRQVTDKRYITKFILQKPTSTFLIPFIHFLKGMFRKM